MKINIGAGSTRYEGFVNCDCSNMYNPEYVFDLEKDIWPFEDNSVTDVIAHHILEHMGEGYFHCLKELYRVCAPGASIDIRVPHHFHNNFFHDATHKRAITWNGLNMFSQKQNHRDFVAGNPTSRLGQELNIDLELINYFYAIDPYYFETLGDKLMPEIEDYIRNKVNIVCEVIIKMLVIKGTREEQICGYYKNYLRRVADPQGLSMYLESNLSMTEILNEIKASEEYSNIQYVEACELKKQNIQVWIDTQHNSNN